MRASKVAASPPGPGYEADDVIGCLAQQASKQNLEVLLVTNDKDMMQLVGDSVRVLRTGPGGGKNDVIVDQAQVKEILGVPPEQFVDVMALMGDTIDNIHLEKGPRLLLVVQLHRQPRQLRTERQCHALAVPRYFRDTVECAE